MKLPHSISTLKAYMKLFNIVKALAKGILCEHLFHKCTHIAQMSIFHFQNSYRRPHAFNLVDYHLIVELTSFHMSMKT